jgi:2-C-methyl-D-erythritol 4-phosphate cytidylyltransferase/2-C-methyl-D-erythritol 2,4-cyclodiphosphate synthase
MSASVAAIVVAAGRGLRAGGDMPKQYRMIGGEPVVRASLSLFANHPEIAHVQPVIHPNDAQMFAEATEGLAILPPVYGGATRQASVRAGLEALPPDTDIVLIHDAARPLASAGLVSRAIAAAGTAPAAVPALPVTDTVKSVSSSGRVLETLDRSVLRIIQTPQAFSFTVLRDAHRRAAVSGMFNFSDDAALAEWAGIAVTTFEGERGNIKLTTADDFARARAEWFAGLSDIRTGSGFDVHVFGDGDHVMLGGVRIVHTRGLIGHSDADVVLHALTDALLGALADGDIGDHFPPSDERWRNAASDQFLAFAAERVRERGGRVAHLDATIVCEAPRIAPHRELMRERIAAIAALPVMRVAVKATTSEKLGFTGRGEGIAAFATATVRLPWSGE